MRGGRVLLAASSTDWSQFNSAQAYGVIRQAMNIDCLVSQGVSGNNGYTRTAATGFDACSCVCAIYDEVTQNLP